ncbi:MAG TPA: protein-glutamate O-methyltransferase CheR [bacterium]|nr:protein-glutamate O-methyltransferase CheR [bacterium]
MIQLTDKQLMMFRDLIFDSSGLWFGDSKLSILGNRIKTRIREYGAESPDYYFKAISSDDDRGELSHLINLVTTNETYFYRSESQMDSFRNIILPNLAEKKVAEGNRDLRIWSAGCSTGEEPYTIAMCMLETIRFHSIWNFYIYATDISTEVLTKAMEGKYSKRSIEKLPEEYLTKYFTYRDGTYQINNTIKKLVEFDYQNLIDAYYEDGFDVIFCRNVLIYFKDKSKREILNRFYDSMNDGGYLFLGATEMIRGLVDGFKLIALKDCVVFQKEPR